MNIALQLAREDFPSIFCATLEHFLRWRDERNYRVMWNGATTKDTAVLYMHPRLGVAVPEWTDPRRLSFIWRELRGGKSLAESLARRLYLAAHLTPGPTRRLLAAHRVTIEPRPPRFGDGFYVPGGNQIRWFDSRDRRCYVALKRGFPERYFRAQVDVRQNYDVPAPHLLEVDEHAHIFVEEIASGRARVDASPTAKEALKLRTLAALQPLAEATSEATTCGQYAAAVIAAIEDHAAGLEAALAERVLTHANELAARLDDAPLQTVIAHGDMSFGHILEDGQRVILVDWEHAGRRQRDHDELTLELRPQLPDRFFSAIAGRALDARLTILLLEALYAHARDSDNPLLYSPGIGAVSFVAGLDVLLERSGMVASH